MNGKISYETRKGGVKRLGEGGGQKGRSDASYHGIRDSFLEYLTSYVL